MPNEFAQPVYANDMKITPDPLDGELTYCEKIATTKWGTYTSEVVRGAILEAHRLAKTPTTAIDIGCEGGRWSKLLSTLGWNLICTDIDEDALAICRKRLPAAKCVLVSPDDSTIPAENETIGLLLCLEVGPVLQADWFIDEALRVLRKKGLVVAIFYNRMSLRGSFVHLKYALRGRVDWYRFSYEPWKSKFCNSGFNMIREEGMCWFPFRPGSNSALVPAATHLERTLGLRRLVNLSPWILFIAEKR